MSLRGKPPKDFEVTGVPEDFQRWIYFENYLKVVEIGTKLDSLQKHALLLNCIGEDAVKVISGLSYDETSDPYEHLVAALTSYCLPKCNLTYERYRFRRMTQEGSVMSFVNELHTIAKKCDFENKTIEYGYRIVIQTCLYDNKFQ